MQQKDGTAAQLESAYTPCAKATRKEPGCAGYDLHTDPDKPGDLEVKWLLNLAAVTINSWSDAAIVITIPAGAASGPLLVAVAPTMNDSNAVAFTVTSNPLPSGWVVRF